MASKHKISFIVIIILIATLTQISTDIYTPSLPSVAYLLHGTLGQAQMTMTWFIFGVAITSLIYGPISEGIGRRWTMVIGNVIAMLGVIICLLADNIHALQIGRLIQGIGLGACAALWRSIFRDTYSGEQMAKVSSYLVNVIILSVILAPFLGGYFQQYLGWKASFMFILAWIIIISLVILFAYKETGQHHTKHRLKLSFIRNAYLELLTSRIFMGYCLCVFLTYGGLFTWITAGPVVLIHGSGVEPVVFGGLMIFTGIAMALGSTFNGKLVKKNRD